MAARSTEFLPAQIAVFLHVVFWGLLLGANVWTTFIAGITMFKNLPRQTFGRLQVLNSIVEPLLCFIKFFILDHLDSGVRQKDLFLNCAMIIWSCILS